MNVRILDFDSPRCLTKEMQKIKVSPYGIKLMLPKAVPFLISLKDIDYRAGNILKQEMLSLGGEAAIPQGAIDGSQKRVSAILIGNQKIFSNLKNKLLPQPFGLSKIAEEIESVIKNYFREEFIIRGANFKLKLGKKTRIMGILNLTPDSFSDGGEYAGIDKAVSRAEEMVNEGADIIDLGGESTRPGARAVSVKEELKRVMPVLRRLRKKIKNPISIDTYKAEVARQTLDAGADIINDITALKGDKKMGRLLAGRGAPVILMHMQGYPRTMQKNPVYRSVVDEIISFLEFKIKKAVETGIDFNNIIIDPGIGFGKTVLHNLEIFKHLKEFKILGRPILTGPSRKAIIGKILNVPIEDRLIGTAALVAYSILKGAQIVRVHDVKDMRRLCRMIDAIKAIN